MVSEKVIWIVTPAKAGVQNALIWLDSAFCRNDQFYGMVTPFKTINRPSPAA